MSLSAIVLLAVALAMDCFAVSVVSGVLLRHPRPWLILRMSLLFGLFQALMPFIGWGATELLSSWIEAYDHWIAFGILAFLGGKMIVDSFSSDGEQGSLRPETLSGEIVLAVATSIDAMAAGISLACTGYSTLTSLWLPLGVIGLVSFLAGVLGNLLGLRFGERVARALRPELAGGIILIAIGFRILAEHLL